MKNQSFKGLKKASLASAIGVFAFTYAGTTLANEEVVEDQVVDTDVVETVEENQTKVINELIEETTTEETTENEIELSTLDKQDEFIDVKSDAIDENLVVSETLLPVIEEEAGEATTSEESNLALTQSIEEIEQNNTDDYKESSQEKIEEVSSPAKSTFAVSNIDIEAPKLVSVATDKNIFHPGEQIQVTILAEDATDLGYASVSFENEYGHRFSGSAFERHISDQGNNQYEAVFTVEIPQNIPITSYKLDSVYVTDDFNSNNYYESDSIFNTRISIVDVSQNIYGGYTEEVVKEEVIPFEHLIEWDENLSPHEHYTKTVGKDGLNEIITHYIYKDGILIGQSEEINVLIESIDEVQVMSSAVESWDYIVETESIPYETIYIEDEYIPEGESYAEQSGRNGYIEKEYSVYYLNGIEQSRILDWQSKVELINEIILIGTATGYWDCDYEIEEIPYETVYIENESVPEGESYSREAGINGYIEREYNVYYLYSGGEESRELIYEHIVEPTNETIIVGTGTGYWGYDYVIEEIPYETEYIEDDSIHVDESYTLNYGHNGFIEREYDVYYLYSGGEGSRELAYEYIVEPETKVIILGTKDPNNFDDTTSNITNNISIIDQSSGNLLENIIFNGWVFDYRLQEHINNINFNNNTEYEITKQTLVNSSQSSISTTGFTSTYYSNDFEVFILNNNTNTISPVKPFLPEGTIYDDVNTNRTLREISIINSYNNETLYKNRYISYFTTDADIREAMSNVDSDINYFDFVDVNSGFTSIITNGMSYQGLSEDVSVYVNKIDMYELNPTVEPIPYEIIYVYDDSLPKGEEYIQVYGVKGVYYIDTEDYYRYGELVDSREVGRHVGKEPINQIVVIGTGIIEVTPEHPKPVVPGEATPEQPEPEVPGEVTPEQPEPEVPSEETPDQPETEIPGEENPEQPDTEVLAEETPEESESEVSVEETPEQPESEIPAEETPEETEVPGAVMPEQPESEIPTEETPEQSEVLVEQTQTDNNLEETDVVNNTESAQVAETATPEKDKVKEERLPDTGVAQSNTGVIAAVAAFFGGLLLFVKGRRKESK